MEKILIISEHHSVDITKHLYAIGRTGSGKSTFLEYAATNLQPFIFIDPHGQSADKLLDHITDAAYFNASDSEHPFQFNPLADVPENLHAAVAGFILDTFHYLFKDSWGPQLETMMLMCLRAVLYTDQPSLLSVYMMLVSAEYRAQTIPLIQDPVVKLFWENEFELWDERNKTERTWSTKNKIIQLLEDPIVRNIISTRNRLDVSKNVLVNLGGLSEHHTALIGSFLIGYIALQKKPTTLIIDEVQYFNQKLITHMLATVRKYGISLIVAHQYLAQIERPTQDAFLGTVGAMLVYHVLARDTEQLTEATHLNAREIATIAPFHAYLIVNGEEKYIKLPRVTKRYRKRKKIIHASRRNFCRPRKAVERDIQHQLDQARSA